MITNAGMNRLAVLVMLFCVYAAGISGGRDQAVQSYQQHPACHLNLKP